MTGGTTTDKMAVVDLEDGCGEAAESEISSGFDDRKAPGAFRTIGEVAKALDIRQHVLRYWEEQFPMLNPVKRSGNRRYYRPEDVAMIETIDRLVHREGYTLRGARLALDNSHKKSKRTSVAVPASNLDGQNQAADIGQGVPESAVQQLSWLNELLAIRATLADALDRAA